MTVKLKNIKVTAAFPVFAAVTYFLSGEMQKNFLWAALFASVHECAHILAIRLFGKRIQNLTFGIMGIRIGKNRISLSYKQECLTAAAGPFVNLFLAIIFYFLKSGNDFFTLPFNINLGLFIINMLPAEIFDGGRIIYNYTSLKRDEKTAKNVICIFEILTEIILAAVLIISLLTDYVNTTFVFFSCNMMVMIFSGIFFKGKAKSIFAS